GRHSVTSDDLAVAVRLVLGPRAVASPEIEEEHAPEDDRTPDDSPREDPSPQPENPDMVDREMSIDAARTNLPPGLLTALMAASTARAQTRSGAGARTHSSRKGRPAGSRPGRPAADARLDVIATLRAAIPWQKIRSKIEGQVIALRSDDFRVRRLKDRTESLTVFAVDASGSSAMARMSEAKGAVEVMLAEAYRRRDFVAVVAFRGSEAEILLPPTRALARAKRALGGLPGGGGTPLAAGLVEATRLAETARRRGQSPMIVALTDGKANVALTGSDNPSAPLEHAQTAARMVRTAGIPSVLIDTARRPQQRASDLAREMGARYVVMPASRPDDAVRAIRNEQ
ncbi:MAG: VWA domain-containing protein, partial [Pseudomonadota bacterium]